MGEMEVFRAENTPDIEQQWGKVYFIGGCAALLSACGTIADIVFGSMTSANLADLPQTAVERFAEFQQNWLLGLYHLDLLNVITAVIMLPAYFAIFGLHRKKSLPYAAIALVLVFLGTTVFVTTNSALPMLELSNKYYAAADETQRSLLAAAGEALLVRGEHGSLGVFLGFASLSLASVGMSLVMWHGRVFSKATAYCGILGNSLLLLYIILVTLIPAVKDMAVLAAAPGGLLALAWVCLTGLQLIKKSY